MASVHTGGPSGSGAGAGSHHHADNDNQSVASDLSTLDFKRGDFSIDLLNLLEAINSEGSFAFNAKLDIPSSFDISVNDVGAISLPLGEAQARQIIKQARQAPYGKGSETIVDTAVRNTWELDPTQFTINWLRWPALLQQVCQMVTEKMGINTPIRAELYKMLLYDTEKIPGMFGTLVVNLPSPHTGGDVVLKHCGEKVKYSSSKQEASCAAWYSDVHHEVLPVTSGYRWVLTYNLAIDQSLPRPSAALKRSELRPLRHCIRRWLARDPSSRKNPFIYHILDHEYTEDSISFRALKGPDIARVTALRQACKGLPVTIFLTLLEREDRGNVEFDPSDLQYNYRGAMGEYDDEYDGGYHCLEEVLESEYRLMTVRDLQGKIVAGQMAIDEENITDPDVFSDMCPVKEDYEGYMGNYGPQATQWYRLGAVALVPHESLVDFFTQSDSSYYGATHQKFPQAPINYLAQQCLQKNVQEHMLTALLDLVEPGLLHMESGETELEDESVLSNVVNAALLHRQYQLVNEVIAKLFKILPSNVFTALRQWMVKSDGEEKAMERFSKVKGGLSLALTKPYNLRLKFQAISHLVPLPRDLAADALPTPAPIMNWTREMLHTSVKGEGPRDVTRHDGSSIVSMSLYFDDPILFLTERVVPIFEKRLAAPAFRFRVLSQLMNLSTNGKLPREEGIGLYRTMARLLITSQNFTLLRDEKSVEEEAKRTRVSWVTIQPQPKRDTGAAISCEILKDFFSKLCKVSTELDDLKNQFLTKVTLQASKLPELELYRLWLPFLRSVIPLFHENSIPLSTQSCQKFFSAVVKAVLDVCLGPQPARPTDWSLSSVPCNCGDCERVNDFLNHPTQMTGRFSMNKSRRQHIHRQVDSAGIGCKHETQRNTNPNTLVITKKTRPLDVERQHWQKVRVYLVEKFSQFKGSELKTLLGSDFEKIEKLCTGETSQASLSRRPAAGEKRRIEQAAEVIDLTSD
ncbi:2OG-Fe(II) oxygenase superfamily [Fusarium subglutinans]|uniref:2OG-Fe(II) oxygenase superfamily n=1 Tax=Gibberella subglutinans TaxID=42677 RepID=A0A8H5Q297_GIBSU|nr:2OG-Fe(II) oxygenase superfamily [Fusarium subglutinans]KAF5606868.1 2OG-Fe(II) oxygenase superfamily [Fusarium subglutinans]